MNNNTNKKIDYDLMNPDQQNAKVFELLDLEGIEDLEDLGKLGQLQNSKENKIIKKIEVKPNKKIKIKLPKISKKRLIQISLLILIILYALYLSIKHFCYDPLSYITFNGSLYERLKYNQISLIVPIYNEDKITLQQIKDFIVNTKNQSLFDIEIIMSFQDESLFNLSEVENLIFDDKRFILNKYIPSSNRLDNIYKLIIKSNSKFVSLFNIQDKLEYDTLEKAFKSTLGKVDYIYEYSFNNKKKLLIKKKIIQDIFDNININDYNNFEEIIKIIENQNKPNINYVNIAYSVDNFYTTLTYVSMLSLLDRKNDNTYYDIYLLIESNFLEENKNLILSLYDQYDLFNITFIDMGNRYSSAYISRHLTLPTYFRLSLGEVIPNKNKIIYLDGDTIIYKDLYNFFNLNFDDKLILGYPNYPPSFKNGQIIHKFNAGVLLMNLKKMREIQMEKKVYEIISQKIKLEHHDQDIINIYFGNMTGIFPAEFHSKSYNSIYVLLYRYLRIKYYGNKDLYVYSYIYPAIRHYNGKIKPLNNPFPGGFKSDFWFFACKSKNYNIILQRSKQKRKKS